MELSFDSLKVHQLKAIIKKFKDYHTIKNYSKMKKTELIKELNKYFNVVNGIIYQKKEKEIMNNMNNLFTDSFNDNNSLNAKIAKLHLKTEMLLLNINSLDYKELVLNQKIISERNEDHKKKLRMDLDLIKKKILKIRKKYYSIIKKKKELQKIRGY